MQFKITLAREAAVTLVRVDGWLDDAGVQELARVIQEVAKPVRLLLHDLRGANALALSMLRELEALGTPLEGLSVYLRLALAHPGGAASHRAARAVGLETPVKGEKR